jgi:O-acetyl-ADP-ribose deacetylase (regulator of RNase III)
MDLPNVIEVAHRSIVDRPADAVVSPANSFGFMDGGVDWAYLQFFGEELQTRVQMVIRLQKFQELPVGGAVVVPTLSNSTAARRIPRQPDLAKNNSPVGNNSASRES